MNGIPPDTPLIFTDADIAAIEHDADFDPTCGMTIAELCQMQPPDTEPADFEDFWRDTYERVRLADSITSLEPHFQERAAPDGYVAYDLSFMAWGGVRVAAWLHEPADGPTRGLVVQGHGYGGPGEPDLGWARHGFAYLQLHQRGFGGSHVAGLGHDSSIRHVIHGIEDRETYVLRGCVAETWQAASLLIHRHPQLREKLFYGGGSFGGGIGALSLAWDPRFQAALLQVPTFGHHPVRLAHKCRGSGEVVRRHQHRLPELLGVLPYYDSATAATYIQCPVHVTVAAFDPSVIPPGQFAVANAIRSEGSRGFIVPAAHFEPSLALWPQHARQQHDTERRDFLLGHAES